MCVLAGGVLRTQESFDGYFELGRDDIASFWGFASTAVASEYLVSSVGKHGSEKQWQEYFMKITACHVRKCLHLLKESGGQLNANGGIMILSGKELREVHDNFFRGRTNRLFMGSILWVAAAVRMAQEVSRP